MILEPSFASGSSPTEPPIPSPTPAPINPTDGICSKYSTTGWHYGSYMKVMLANEAPDGSWWSWEECAKECALFATALFGHCS